MNKRLRVLLMLIVIVASLMAVSVITGANCAAAESAPQVVIEEQNKVIIKEQGQTQFDMKSLFTIDCGSYTKDQLSIAYSVKMDDVVVPHEELIIDYTDGSYTLTVLIIGKGVNIGAPVMQDVYFELTSEAPSFRNAESMHDVKTINVQKNQGFIDLRILYAVQGNSFAENEWTVSYDAKYPGRTVEIFGDFIKSISGVYTITITIQSKKGMFEDVNSVPMTVIVQKSRPEVTFEYETESGKTVIHDEHTVYVYQGTQYVDLTEYFTIYGNAYVRNEYAYSLIVKRELSDGYENCQVFDGMIAPKEGVYSVVVKVNPKIQGAFTPVVSDTVKFYIKKAVPKVYERNVYINKYDNKKKEINLSAVMPLSNSAYTSSQYTVDYSFERKGKTYQAVDGKIKLRNGEYKVISTVSSVDGSFTDQVTELTMTVDVPVSIAAIITFIAVAVLIIAAGITVLIIVKKKKIDESFAE